MQQVTHMHPYSKAPPYEAFTVPTLLEYWEDTPSNAASLSIRSQLATELALHPTASNEIRDRFHIRRLEIDEEMMSQGYSLGNIHETVGKVFAPLIFGMGKDSIKSAQLTIQRAKKVLNLCEDAYHWHPCETLGLASEIFFIAAMNTVHTACGPSLNREDTGWRYQGKNVAWDAVVVSAGSGAVPKGLYRAQIKHGCSTKAYHPDIVVVQANPYDEFRVPEKGFFHFTRMLLPGTAASQRQRHKLEGRVQTLQETLRRHGPSRLRKIADACLLEAA